MNGQDRLAELRKRQLAVRAELKAINDEIAEIEAERFPKQKRPILRIIKGGGAVAALATVVEKARKHPGVAAALAGGAMIGGVILGQLPGDEDQITSDPQKLAPGVSVPWTPPPGVPTETPGPAPSAAPEAPAEVPEAVPGVQVQDEPPSFSEAPEGPLSPMPEPPAEEPEPSPEPTVPAPPSPTQPPSPSPSPSPTATPTASPSPTPEPPTPAEPEHLVCVDADLSLLELELCLLEYGNSA